MIRFLPDTWSDALLRPLYMALPDANIYVEIMAPDTRFAAVIGLVILWVAARKTAGLALPLGNSLASLLIFATVAFGVWLASSGNGRYFLPVLILVGVCCIAVLDRLPGTRSFKSFVAGGLIVVQFGVFVSADPFRWWGLAPWMSPFYPVQLDERARTEPATYVIFTPLSRSLIAPKFPAKARWVNIAPWGEGSAGSVEAIGIRRVLESSGEIYVLLPSRPAFMDSDGLPVPELVRLIGNSVAGHGLTLKTPLECRFLQSQGLVSEMSKDPTVVVIEKRDRIGFWICPASHSDRERASNAVSAPADVLRIVDAVERQCPRFFPPGQTTLTRIEGGWERHYSATDLRLFLFDDNTLYYRYWRAVNPGYIGTAAQAMDAPQDLKCRVIRGRSGAPWERNE